MIFKKKIDRLSKVFRRHFITILVFTGISIIAGIAICHFRESQLDDAFITYRYARSIASGAGFSYNSSEIVFGTTTPLYTLILALAALAREDIPTAALRIGWVSLIVLTGVTANLAKRVMPYPVAVAAACYLIVIPGNYMVLGMETLLYTALVVASLLAGYSRKYKLAILLSAMATLTRYDGIIITTLILLQNWLESHRFPWKLGLFYIILLLPWLFSAFQMFGTFLPQTYFVKTGYSQSSNAFLTALPGTLSLELFYRLVGNIPPMLIGLISLLVLVGFIRLVKTRSGRILSAWPVIYVIEYSMLRLREAYLWYYYPLIPFLLIMIVLGLETIVHWVASLNSPLRLNLSWLAFRAGILLSILLFFMTLLGGFRFWIEAPTSTFFGARYQIYTQAAKSVCQITPLDATIAIPEIGIFGWNCPRRIIDPYGLVTPQMTTYLHSGQQGAGVFRLQPDYLVITNLPLAQPDPFYTDPVDELVRYSLVMTFTQPGFPYLIAVYTRVGL